MMTEQQRAAQIRAVIVQYNKLVKDGVLQRLHENMDESRKIWASQICGRVISTFNTLFDCELNALRDVLNGKTCKVWARLRDVLNHTKKDPDSWVNWMMHNAPKFARYRDPSKRYTCDTIPLVEAWRLIMQEERRAARAGYHKENWTPLQQLASRPRRNEEQLSNWGM